MDFSLKRKTKECGKLFKGYFEERTLMVNGSDEGYEQS